MTTVACTLQIMAADSQGTCEQGAFPLCKLYRHDGMIIGMAGTVERFEDFVAWITSGKTRAPRWAEDDELGALVLTHNGIIAYETPRLKPISIHAKFYAIGTGAMAARAVMTHQQRLGMPIDPVSAIEVAACVDERTGGAVQLMEL